MRIREGCILTATNSSDERVKSLIGCKGALHVVNGELFGLSWGQMRTLSLLRLPRQSASA